MGQISGINASSITSIAGVAVANISYVGPVSAAALGLGGGSIAPGNFPYSFVPGSETITGATFSKASDIEQPSDYKILGAQRGFAYDTNPTFQLSNISSKFYNIGGEGVQSYVISQWVRVNNFPSHDNKFGSSARKKRTALARYDFKTSSDTNLSTGYIEFGAVAPYYTNGVDFKKKYKFSYNPFSFGVCISNYKHPITLYTDYQFELGTWYMLSVEIQFEGGIINEPSIAKNVKMWVNGTNVNTALFLGKPWSTKVKNNTNRNKGNSGGARLGNIFANIPGFKDYYLNSIYNQSQWNLTFKSFVNIFEMNHASFSPVTKYEPDYNNGTNQPVVNSNIVNKNSYVDFGELNIYDVFTGNSVEEMYGVTFGHYT